MKKAFLKLVALLWLPTLHAAIPERDLRPNEIIITTLTNGRLVTETLTSDDLTKYKQEAERMPRVDVKDTENLGYTKKQSVAECGQFYPVYFYQSDPKKHKRILIMTLPGVMAPYDAQGVIATALGQQADVMLLGHLIGNIEKGGAGFKHGNFNDYLEDQRTKDLGGAAPRMVEDPAQDIKDILKNGITFTYQDGAVKSINPYDYDIIIAAGLCMGISPFIRAQQELLTNKSRGFDGFIMESPTNYGQDWPKEWGKKPANFGQTHYLIREIKQLKTNGQAVPVFILRGGLDDVLSPKSLSRAILKASVPYSMVVEHAGAKHTRFMYDDNTDPGLVKDGEHYERIRGGNAVGSALMRQWLTKNFMQK